MEIVGERTIRPIWMRDSTAKATFSEDVRLIMRFIQENLTVKKFSIVCSEHIQRTRQRDAKIVIFSSRTNIVTRDVNSLAHKTYRDDGNVNEKIHLRSYTIEREEGGGGTRTRLRSTRTWQKHPDIFNVARTKWVLSTYPLGGSEKERAPVHPPSRYYPLE